MSLLGKIDPLWRRVLSAAIIATGLLATAGMTTPVKAQYYGYPYYAGYCDPYYNPYACYGAYAYGYPYYGYGYGYPAAFIGFGFGGHRFGGFHHGFHGGGFHSGRFHGGSGFHSGGSGLHGGGGGGHHR
jgi:hypothetical protein